MLSEILAALVAVFSASRVGVRFSPFSKFSDAFDSDPVATFSHAIKVADRFNLGYLHLIEGDTGGARDAPAGTTFADLRRLFRGAYMANNGYDRDLAIKAVQSGDADLVAFGRPYIANPDLPARLEKNATLNGGNQATYYGGGAEGYTDYPAMRA